ncbi:LolA family protein [Streptomyces sp. P1-3]|uniref:LolA family protein n=1 Tax=Streptomyces sp. P1-3 TaxID=3421658 RepID=UPI003D36511E
MARIRPTQVAEDDHWDDEQPVRRRKAVRYAVPVAVAGVAAATIGLVPALADSGDPDLPKISAEELIGKIAASDTEQMSGTMKISTDLGLPSLPSGLSLGGGGDADGASASPESKLPELASGTHTLRFAVDGPDRQRVSIIEDAAEYSLIHNGDDVWAYDSAANAVYHAEAPKGAEKGAKGKPAPELPKDLRDATPQELAKQALAAVDDTTEVKVDGTAKVAGQDAYQLLIKPRESGSTIGSIRIAVDADTGVPLKFTLSPKGGGKAAVEIGFTKVDFGKPSADRFAFTPPKGAKVTEQRDVDRKAEEYAEEHGLKQGSETAEPADFSGLNVIGEGWGSIARLDLPKEAASGLNLSDLNPSGQDAPSKAEGAVAGLIDGLGDKVKGDFGSGTVFSTRLVNALLTDDGKVFVGAVDKDALVDAANAAK